MRPQSDIDENIALTDADLQSAAWIKIKAKCEARIKSLRRQNDGDKDPIETAKIRGRIAEVKKLLAMENPSPTTAADDD